MTAQIPQGLIRVVSATRTEEPSDPADVIYERKVALHNFWKVHAAQSRASNDVSSIRCRQLFWRVWGDPTLSTKLSEATLMRLWLDCQRETVLKTVTLPLGTSQQPTGQINFLHPDLEQRRSEYLSSSSLSTDSLSPSQVAESSDVADTRHVSGTKTKSGGTRPADSKLDFQRTSPADTGRKRSSVAVTATRGKTRPAMSRKRSSQTDRSSDTVRPRRSIIKSPRSSSDVQARPEQTDDQAVATIAQMTASPGAAIQLPGRKISAFELPSASSWQSVDSHAGPPVAGTSATQASGSFLVDKNFRERFLESQQKLRSSTNLPSLQKAMRKTGSVVRFADEVDTTEEFRAIRYSDSDTRQPANQVGSQSSTVFLHRAASDGHPPRLDQDLPHTVRNPGQAQPRPWRPSGIERHDSTGSVAAVSDDDTDSATDTNLDTATAAILPRTRSQLTLAIADLKRSQSLGENENEVVNADRASKPDISGQPLTSPAIEAEQDALISGKTMKRPSAEEQKLLAMGRRDGVTKSGGVNLPKELLVKGTMTGKFVFEEPEESHF